MGVGLFRLDFLEKNADQKEEWWSAPQEEEGEGEAMEGVVHGDEEAKVHRLTLLDYLEYELIDRGVRV